MSDLYVIFAVVLGFSFLVTWLALQTWYVFAVNRGPRR